ncbi:hypothetical protein Pst134EA_017699 [Puccinia striiformis f. sp. tritici]|uniref:uncharacterized protein n=1 Tax=Puccinia striiformis f. sp. tritici TaxID=168172 RepID=UPI0020082C1F|nr:uncharacterized protein Pst134EA_032448 [Puccinia striiformis f. sp. tritici]XP_047804340.1 hypothetical protein Pst134EA_017699 [Puccinia striiformis f. sp. tritici]KAH9444248.1 hypothetical protein Pst134EA_032448 [Puccinia striiformis f. sp. tritici]KAH9451100.1 hypothetical protein Pst134EB_018598 [Puccinia striiformis f. sp. tritici]KAH9461393.1 hypothetical protein Pst134EA_017699 [Puccinia striiformis f. sp. tritici]
MPGYLSKANLFAGTLPGADQAESSNAAQIVGQPAASTQEHQPGPKQYGIIPDALAERNGEFSYD